MRGSCWFAKLAGLASVGIRGFEPGMAQNKYQAQRAMQRNGEMLSGQSMVGVQRLDIRFRPVADSLVTGRQDAVLPSTPSAMPIRPYRIDAPRSLVSTPICCLRLQALAPQPNVARLLAVAMLRSCTLAAVVSSVGRCCR